MLGGNVMMGFFVFVILAVSIFKSDVYAKNAETKAVDLSLATYNSKNKDDAQQFTIEHIIKSLSVVEFNIRNVPSAVSFLIAQVHTYKYNVTLSYNAASLGISNNRSVLGTNIGLYVKTNQRNESQLFVQNVNTVNVSALFAVVAYSSNAPTPGGCNMEFDLEISPFHKLHLTNASVIVDVQAASRPDNSENQTICDKENDIDHNMYLMYLPEQDSSEKTYFESIKMLLTPQDIELNAWQVPLSAFGSAMRRVYSAYAGTGSAYATVAIYGDYSSAYVPALTYACDPFDWINTCDVLSDRMSSVLCGLTLFLGLVVTFFGRRLFKMEMFLVGCFAGGMIGYFLATVSGLFTDSGNSAAALIFGVFSGIIWWTLWLCLKEPMMLVLLATGTFGFLCSSFVYYSIPDGTSFVQNDLYFWLVFLITMIVIALVLSVVPYFGIRVCCSVLGAYAIILPIDYYIGSNLKYILINVMRRVTYSDFRFAVIHPPFQYKDVLLLVLWIFLTFVSLFKQALLFKKSPYAHV